MGLADRSLPTKAYARSINHLRPDANGNVNVTVGDLTDVDGTPSDGDTFIYNSTTQVYELGSPSQSRVDTFTITDDATDTFPLSLPPVPDSWNVHCGWVLDEVDYTIIGSTLTILDAPTVFVGASAAYPKTLRVQYDYVTGVASSEPPPVTPPADSWSITAGQAVSNDTTGIPYLGVGVIVNSVEATISGNMDDIGVGIHASDGNNFTAQYEQVGTHQVRILTARNGVDETGGAYAEATQTLSAGDVLKLAVDWATGDVEMFVNGVSVLTSTMSAEQFAAYAGATAVHFRTPNSGAIFDDLKVNGTLVDDFNRADGSALGTSSSGAVWTQE